LSENSWRSRAAWSNHDDGGGRVMKWFYWPILAILVFLLWTRGLPLLRSAGLAIGDAPAGTPLATAEAYMRAAAEGNWGAVKPLCAEGAEAAALEAGQAIHALNPDTWSLALHPTTPAKDLPGHKAFSCPLGRRLVVVEVVGSGEKWAIADVAM